MVARFAPALSGFATVPNGVLVAAAAGKTCGADVSLWLRIALYRAMLILVRDARCLRVTGVAAFRVKERALKARNAWDGGV